MLVASALLFGCQNFNDALTDLDNRVSELEGGKIASIEQQIERINISISDLEEVSHTRKERQGDCRRNSQTQSQGYGVGTGDFGTPRLCQFA